MRKLLLIALALVAFVSACSGGNGDESEPGAKDPQSAVRNLLDGIVERDQAKIEAAINPIYANSPGEIGVGDLIRLSELDDMEIRNLELEAEYDSSREHARVFINATVVTPQGEANLRDKVLLASTMGERWYVTSPNSEFWASQLRPPPSAWQEVQADANPNLPGIYIPPHPGADGQLLTGNDDRAHFANDVTMPICTEEQIASGNISNPLCYPSNPPTSGPHTASAAPFRVFPQPVGKEFLVHTMEHGAVVIWYNSNDPAIVQRLAAIAEQNIQRGKLVAMTAYAGMEPDTIALTAWTRIDKFPSAEFTPDRVQLFIDVHERRFNPEGF